ncbi:hypothetical protein RJ640_003466 [Escallonia rubra]|uniref:Leucine-rich repeat-containing N-terminal plant-type domain-containing protein n=1 Tax=Escallonia rubra TaxID=112253 RepID=A0AA88QH56_9ASTE|nr:hypothetical protein RJ640_003466 [Escallonia rubra]
MCTHFQGFNLSRFQSVGPSYSQQNSHNQELRYAVTKDSLTWVLVMQSCVVSLAISSSNITDQLALLAIKSEIVYDPNSVLAGNWTENTNFCDWYGSHAAYAGRESQLCASPTWVFKAPFLHISEISPSLLSLVSRTIASMCQKLQVISLAINGFTGGIPQELSTLPLLRLFLDENNLTGIIPPSFGNISSLKVLSMAFNNLSGSIPTELAQLSNLQELYLNENHLSGLIPPELFNLDLRFNDLNGVIPSTIGGMTTLQRLYLGRNKIEGTIPNEICLLRNLGEIGLHDNKLYGSVPNCIGNLSSLQRIYLSLNTFRSIPSTLWNLENLLYLSPESNSISGTLDPNLRVLKALGSMDLSGNQISGNIPSTIGAFESLTYLNLSGNSFSGPIPESLSDLVQLNILDLSRNNLSGAIPKSLNEISQLEYLNLSFNKLTGEIPSGGQFGNFTAQSFIGNEALCGNATLQVPPCTSHTSKNSLTKDLLLKCVLPAAFAFAAISVSVFFILTRYQRKHVSSPVSVDLLPTGEYRRISYHELRHATNEFCEANLVGAVSFGSVYKGILSDGTDVAVKVLNLQLEGAYKSFDSECKVTLIPLVKETRKVDHGLGHSLREYGYEGKVSIKGDMYSFGIMLLKNFTKKKPTDDIFTGELSLRQWVSSSLPHRIMEVVDKGLTRKEDGEDMITTKGTILALMELGLECSKGLPEERSNIKEVVIKLSKIRSQLICNRGG